MKYKNGEPCSHTGCLNHTSHPCEGCGRINGISKPTKIFFDCEFTGLHQKTTLISICLISECGKTFYAEFNDYDKSQANEWLQENVIDNLTLKTEHVRLCVFSARNNEILKGNKKYVKMILLSWLTKFESIEMWSDCLSYDWVLFNDLIADYTDGYPKLPKNMNYIPFDICTLFKIKGIDPDINREEFAFETQEEIEKFRIDFKTVEKGKHNALWDAKVIKACYEKLIGK